jgi:Calcineurin-like phosphoesterase
MQEINATERVTLLYFWAIGDLHYRAINPWQRFHVMRLSLMYHDLHELWGAGGPAFCVSPGDLVETAAMKDYQIAKASILSQMERIPFYPGVGNHEFYGLNGELPAHMGETFTSVWQKPLRYSWTYGAVTCIMLDHPDPHTLDDPKKVVLSQETLDFLETTLATHQDGPAVIFLHCPLYNTVLERDEATHSDFSSLNYFFAPVNSQEVRDILARHKQACLFISGHTHSGWETPGLVKTEQLGGHSVTFVNLMSPWYTGNHTGPSLHEAQDRLDYIADTPDVIPTFAFRVYEDGVNIRVRDSKSKTWLKEWDAAL